ncbi:endonuclease V, putative [Bodo saltans]|uniref:Endonuclease V, putative n=1 Tax=Bodo saltans TaxID=75058 RepID=A0A0S4JP02_BODSA|nr:endonuclease V, putative [Bodo saltans]|eukprot:CUG93244.1 endonuclease V, putative [Bodo saltans]
MPLSWADRARALKSEDGTAVASTSAAQPSALPAEPAPPAKALSSSTPMFPLPSDEENLEATRTKWLNIQRKMAPKVIVNDEHTPFQLPTHDPTFCRIASNADPSWSPPDYSRRSPSLPQLSIIAGIDISFVDGTDLAVASIAVFSFPEMKLLGTLMHHCVMQLPYICTFLAFREVPPIEALLDLLQATQPHLYPQLLFVDGNGYHHPRHCGVACHLGVVRGIPTIGVAKDLLAVKGLSREGIADALVAAAKVGTKIVPLVTAECPLWGHVALTGNSTKKPIYISPGHMISFGSAAALTWIVSKMRIPEPIRQADLLSRAYIKSKLKIDGADAIAAPGIEVTVGSAAVARK